MKSLQKACFLTALAAALLCFATPGKVLGEEAKIGVVNFKKCVEESKIGKREQGNLESLRKQMVQSLEEKEKELTEVANKFNDSDYRDSLSATAEAELKHKFRSLNQELGQQEQQFSQMLSQANFQSMQQITQIINVAAQKVAGEQHLDLIANEEGTFFYSPKLDVTEAVIKIMDENFKDDQRAA